jgi:hypothetical protein
MRKKSSQSQPHSSHCKHPHSSRISDYASKIQKLEKDLRKLGISISYPSPPPTQDVPMLGHTKGNTKSNRKIIKRRQEKELHCIYVHLLSLLPKNEENEMSGDNLKEYDSEIEYDFENEIYFEFFS